MIIREYAPSDSNELASLFYDTVHTVNAKDYTAEQLDLWTSGASDLEHWNKSLIDSHSFVAIDHGQIVGFGDIDQSGYLQRLFVHRNFQGKGIGTAICNQLEKSVDVDKIITHASITAKEFYENRGYSVVKKEKLGCKGVFLDNYLMTKRP